MAEDIRLAPSLAEVQASRIREIADVAFTMEGVLKLQFGEANRPTPSYIKAAATQALENDYGVREIADTYNGRRKVFLDAIRGLNDITVRGSEGGMYAMLDVTAIEPDDEKFAWAFLDAENVGVMPGSSFGDAAAGHIRISLCQPNDVLLDAAKRLRRFASSYRNKAA